MKEGAADRPTVSVVLPTYNEKDNIGPLIQRTFQALGRAAEVIVVDDNSPDGTASVVEGLQASYADLRLLRRTREKGLVSALRSGVEAARADLVAWMDCDLSMPPELFPGFLEKIGEGYDMVLGSRFIDGGGVEIITGSKDTVMAYLFSRALNTFLQAWLDPGIRDYTSGFVVLRKELVQEIGLRGDYGEYFIALAYLAKKKGYRVLEIPYVSLSRRMGASKTGASVFDYLRKGRKYVWLALTVKFVRSPKTGS